MLRLQQQDWGDQVANTFQPDAKVQCVRRFGLPKAAWDEATGETDVEEGGWGITEIERHVTSVRMSRHVSHEVGARSAQLTLGPCQLFQSLHVALLHL